MAILLSQFSAYWLKHSDINPKGRLARACKCKHTEGAKTANGNPLRPSSHIDPHFESHINLLLCTCCLHFNRICLRLPTLIHAMAFS